MPETSPPIAKTTPYFVLARKYRPRSFADLIGQDVMVRTLRNAFAMDRIAQAYMLTGVRGVGKTTTARILARALNYQIDNGDPGAPMLDMPALGVHCQAIMDSRHVDVLEMDAASNTGIDDIREIIEAVRYKPAVARYRVFIIDEVHMLSKAAFNGLLKTLEEPPPHVRFIFATTEIRKVPVTVLSRCQRFDLRRVEIDVLQAHLAKIVALEGQSADGQALALIARAAEGSVRDSLSLLDQALTLGRGTVDTALTLDMLGIASRDSAFGLLNRIFEGDTAGALSVLTALYSAGADPATVLTDLADAIHTVSRLKAIPGAFPADFSEEDRLRSVALTEALSTSRLSMAWQMLLKGLDEVSRAGRPLAAAEMVLIRMCHASGLPAPADVIGELKGKLDIGAAHTHKIAPLAKQERSMPTQFSAETSTHASAPSPDRPSRDGPCHADLSDPLMAEGRKPAGRSFASFADIAAYAGEIRDIKLKIALEEQTELVSFVPPALELHLLDNAPADLVHDLVRKLRSWTGERWIVSVSERRGEPPIAQARREREAHDLEDIRKHPIVKRVLHHFPDAKIKAVKSLKS